MKHIYDKIGRRDKKGIGYIEICFDFAGVFLEKNRREQEYAEKIMQEYAHFINNFDSCCTWFYICDTFTRMIGGMFRLRFNSFILHEYDCVNWN